MSDIPQIIIKKKELLACIEYLDHYYPEDPEEKETLNLLQIVANHKYPLIIDGIELEIIANMDTRHQCQLITDKLDELGVTFYTYIL